MERGLSVHVHRYPVTGKQSRKQNPWIGRSSCGCSYRIVAPGWPLLGLVEGSNFTDLRAQQVFFVKFGSKKNMWTRGGFGEVIVNNSALHDPWSQTGKANTPFDQPFYLILNVAVGATNGFFKDGVGNKPWGDGSDFAPKQFWDSKDQWYPTWGKGAARGMTIQSVRMWQQGACKK